MDLGLGGKRILVGGASGYIGGRLASALSSLSHLALDGPPI